MKGFAEYIVGCNGVNLKKESETAHYLELEHNEGCSDKNVNIKLTKFIKSTLKLDKRYKDLLEIAGYVFAADRESYRGKEDDVEYHHWSRSFHFHINVRDYNFWNQEKIKHLLNRALCFMTGDHRYQFTFYKEKTDCPTTIFDTEEFVLDTPDNLRVALFSGGIDSLAGAIELLETTNAEICLVSHQSGQPSVKKTQKTVYEILNELYPNRCKHYKFHCGLSHLKSKDETQRTRSFLFTATAFAIAETYNQNCIYVFENGITSLNFAETQDLMNGRASRTTHPQTLGLLEKLFSEIADKPFSIKVPYVFKTKTEVVEILKTYNRLDLLDSSVSCSTTRDHPAGFTHCGVCSQCIDRRFAVYATHAEEYDGDGLYHYNFLKEDLEEDVIKKSLTDYIRLAQSFANQSQDGFYISKANEIIEIEEYIEGADEDERVEKLYNLCKKHSLNIENAILWMRKKHDSLYAPLKPKSFFNLILGTKIYQQEVVSDKENETRKKEIPSRELKNIAKEACERLINESKITEVLTETKKKKMISPLIVNELKKEYEISHSNENSISDYFRKLILQIKRDRNGGLIVKENHNYR